MEWIWILGVFLFLGYVATGALRQTNAFPGIRPLLEVGPMKMDWRDILALLIVGIVVYAIYTGQLSARDALIIIGGILVGKSVSK